MKRGLSFRARLSLWNGSVLALVLLGFGLALCYGMRSAMLAAVDRDLAGRARHFARGPLPGPAPPFRPPGPPPDRYRGLGPPPLESRPEPRVETLMEEPEERAAFFARARFVMADGQVPGPPGERTPWDLAAVPAALSGDESYTTVSAAGERVRVLSMPVWRGGLFVGAVQVARPLGEFDRMWAQQIRLLLTLLPAALLVAALGGLFLTTRSLRPVREVTQAAAQIGAEDLSRRLKVTGRDELAELASTFNGMIARLEAAFEQQRRFTADASHELRTPLARIKLTASEALTGDQSAGEYRRALEIVNGSADAMNRLVQQLLLLARVDAGQLLPAREPVDLGAVAREAAEPFAEKGPSLRCEIPDSPVVVEGNADQLGRIVTNLLENAVRHTPREGSVTVIVRQEGPVAVLAVRDTGEGVPAEHLPHLGERFYRVDTARARRSGGCGLGLAICRSLAEAHGGQLSIESECGEGTTVTVRLPLRR